MLLHQTRRIEKDVPYWDRELNAVTTSKEMVTEYVRGTDKEREAIKEKEKEIIAEIERVKKQISDLESRIDFSKRQERHEEPAEDRFYGMDNFQKSLEVFPTLEKLDDSFTDQHSSVKSSDNNGKSK